VPIVLSHNYFPPINNISMRKLSKKKIRWILRWKQRGLTNKEIATAQKITPRWVRFLYSQYKNKGHVTVKMPGRPRKIIPLEDIKLILKEHPVNSGACILEKTILAKHKIRIPHNRIHMVLKHAGYAKDEPNKQKRRRPWVRFERKHSLSMVQTDWHESKAIPGKQLITYLDDASRMILAIDEHDAATTENAIKTLKQAMKIAEPYYGIRSVLSDHGSQFMKEYNEELEKHGIRHIYGRIKHPQTQGKMERFHQTYNQKRNRFKTLEKFKNWYNEERAHMSLKLRYAETPSQAFIRKMDPIVWVSIVSRWFK